MDRLLDALPRPPRMSSASLCASKGAYTSACRALAGRGVRGGCPAIPHTCGLPHPRWSTSAPSRSVLSPKPREGGCYRQDPSIESRTFCARPRKPRRLYSVRSSQCHKCPRADAPRGREIDAHGWATAADSQHELGTAGGDPGRRPYRAQVPREGGRQVLVGAWSGCGRCGAR